MAHDVPPNQLEGIIDACVHLDAAARLIEAGHTDDPFHPNLALAAHVGLLAAAIHPGVQASELPGDPWDATQHLDHAVALLNSLPPKHRTGEMHRWWRQLAQLREAVGGAGANGYPNRAPR